MEYFENGPIKAFTAFSTNGSSPNHAGDIGVFLNYKLIGRFKKKSEALELVNKLIKEAPSDDFEKFDTLRLWLK